jgi:hypothetical protein
MDQRSPAQTFALVIGVTLVLAGVTGFFYEASFSTGGDVDRDAEFGLFDINGWHNAVHILTGVLGLLVIGSFDGARAYALAVGAVYVALGVVGLALGDGEVLFDLVPLNTEDNILHLLIGVAGIAAFGATGDTPDPSTV